MKRLVLILLLLAGPAFALDPSEMLADPELEARARALDDELRCVKCQSEALSSSNADWAQDARRMVRELITDGASDQEVLDWFHDRYGDFVLMNPPRSGTNLVLWWAGPILLLLALGIGWSTIRNRSRAAAPDDLNEAEKEELARILGK